MCCNAGSQPAQAMAKLPWRLLAGWVAVSEAVCCVGGMLLLLYFFLSECWVLILIHFSAG